MPTKTTIQALRSQIGHNRILSTSQRYFVPPSSLSTIFTEAAVHEAVAELECEPEERIGLAQTILDKVIIIFAILVWMKEEDAIVIFRSHDVLDHNLPLDAPTAESISIDFGSSFAREYQWQFIPYAFSADMADHHRKIRSEYILPFIGGLGPYITGGFSIVHRLEIHPTLQGFHTATVRMTARLSVVFRMVITESNTDIDTGDNLC